MSPWIRLKRDRLALACMGFLGVVLVLGLLAPILPLSDPVSYTHLTLPTN